MIFFFRGQGFGPEFFSSRPQYGIQYINNDSFVLGGRDLVRSFFRLALSMGFSKLELLGQNLYVRAPSSGGGSNAPRPAVSVPRLDVNADRP